MEKGTTTAKRTCGSKEIDIPASCDQKSYHEHMVGVDRGDQHPMMGGDFSNVSHFKK